MADSEGESEADAVVKVKAEEGADGPSSVAPTPAERMLGPSPNPSY